MSAHVLAFAAKGILRGVAKADGVETFDDQLEQRIKPEFIKQWREAVSDAYNVFKHANEDPKRELENFRPETTTIALFTAVTNYGLVYKQRTFPMAAYFGWFISRHPKFALPPLSDELHKWKGSFGHPEGKPLSAAISGLAEAISLDGELLDEAMKQLPDDIARNIER